MTQVVTRVRRRVTRSSMTRVSNSSMVPDSDSGKESGIASDKGPGKRPGKTGRFLCFGVNPS
jgi:hypothetical protein